MSLQDVKDIDWKHLDFKQVPQYILIGGALVILGILLLLAGFLL